MPKDDSVSAVFGLLDWASVTGAFIIAPILAFPTLADLRSRGNYQEQRESRLWIEENLCFNAKNVREGRWWCVPMASYVHENDQHKQNNALALLLPSLVVYDELGSLGVLALFHLPAVLFALDPLKLFEYEVKAKGMTTLKIPTVSSTSEPLSHFTDAMNTVSSQVNRALGAGMDVIAPIVVERSNVIGASGGVYALASASVVFSIVFGAEAIVQLVRPTAPKRWGSPKSPQSLSKRVRYLMTLFRSLSIISSFLPPLLDNMQFLRSGHGALRTSQAGHAYGTCAGTGVALLTLAIRRLCMF